MREPHITARKGTALFSFLLYVESFIAGVKYSREVIV